MKKLLKNRTLAGIAVIILSLIVCFGLTPLFNDAMTARTDIARVKTEIKRGELITPDMLEIVTVGAYNLPANVIAAREDIAGRYALTDLQRGDYVLPAKLSDKPLSEFEYLSTLDGTKQAMSVTIKSFAAGLSGKLEAGDIVTLIASDYGDRRETSLRPELQYVYVLAVTAGSGKLIFIDPETEYKDLCRELNGDWINVAGGSKGMINPLQIRPVPRDEDNEESPLYRDEGQGMGDMALYLQSLEVYFKLKIPSLSDMQRAILKQSLIELYNRFNIFWETDITTLKNTDFPIMADLHNLLEEKAKEYPDKTVYSDLALLFYDMAKGGDSFLCNGHTTVETSSRCVVLDTNALQNTSDNTKSSQYYNTTTWCWEQMSRNRNERVMLICDEAYLLIDPKVPQTLTFLRNVEKRARKYESALVIVSHSLVDFLSPEVKMYGQALLDIPCLKILMGTDGQNLMEIKNLYNLTTAEEELLAAKKRAHALMIVGSKRLHVHFEIPAYKFEYMGKAGGR